MHSRRGGNASGPVAALQLRDYPGSNEIREANMVCENKTHITAPAVKASSAALEEIFSYFTQVEPAAGVVREKEDTPLHQMFAYYS
jgi:hypothetical protein